MEYAGIEYERGAAMSHSKVMDYNRVVDWLAAGYEEVGGVDFYQDIFPNNENAGEYATNYQKPNAIYLYRDSKKNRMRRRIMLNDTFEEDFFEFVENNPMTLCSGLSYRGRRNTLEAAQRLHALVFDLDSVGYQQVRNLFLRIGREKGTVAICLPMPTYIVASGSGLHLYYVLDEPIDLYPNIKLQFKAMKYGMTKRLWDTSGKAGTTLETTVQYQGISQGFRMVGSVNNKHDNFRIRAFRTGPRVTLETLNDYLQPEERVDNTLKWRPTTCKLNEAKMKWPEWYESRIIRHEMPGHWTCKTDLYHWWLRKIDDGQSVVGGHRYFYLMCLAIYAVKCGISKKQLKSDMQAIFPKLRELAHENEFTQKDVDSALEAYDKGYFCFTRDDISKLSGIQIQPNKRNGRKRADHIRLMNFVRDELNGNKDTWHGRKPKGEAVFNWRQEHPEGRKIDCQNDTGLSKPTVIKWWSWTPENN